jgi:hypothetical protein
MTERVKLISIALLITGIFLILSVGFYFLYSNVTDLYKRQKAEIFQELHKAFSAPDKKMTITVEEQPGGSETPYTVFNCSSFGCGGLRMPGRLLRAHGDVIQVQGILIKLDRFGDIDRTEGAGIEIPLFYKIFVSGRGSFEKRTLAAMGQIPDLYRIPGKNVFLQKRIWKDIWDRALDMGKEDTISIHNVVIRPVEGAFKAHITYTVSMSKKEGMAVNFPPVTNFSPRNMNGRKGGQYGR